jgi:hypothetical protein
MLLVIGLGVLIPGLILLRNDRRRVEKNRPIECPRHGRTFDARIVEDTMTGRALHVVSCDAWMDWTRAGCGAPCLRELNASATDRR